MSVQVKIAEVDSSQKISLGNVVLDDESAQIVVSTGIVWPEIKRLQVMIFSLIILRHVPAI